MRSGPVNAGPAGIGQECWRKVNNGYDRLIRKELVRWMALSVLGDRDAEPVSQLQMEGRTRPMPRALAPAALPPQAQGTKEAVAEQGRCGWRGLNGVGLCTIRPEAQGSLSMGQCGSEQAEQEGEEGQERHSGFQERVGIW